LRRASASTDWYRVRAVARPTLRSARSAPVPAEVRRRVDEVADLLTREVASTRLLHGLGEVTVAGCVCAARPLRDCVSATRRGLGSASSAAARIACGCERHRFVGRSSRSLVSRRLANGNPDYPHHESGESPVVIRRLPRAGRRHSHGRSRPRSHHEEQAELASRSGSWSTPLRMNATAARRTGRVAGHGGPHFVVFGGQGREPPVIEGARQKDAVRSNAIAYQATSTLQRASTVTRSTATGRRESYCIAHHLFNEDGERK